MLRSLYQGKRWLTWSNHRILSVLRIRVEFLLTNSIFRSMYNRRRREDNSLKIYTLFQFFREAFFIHLMNGEFLKLMSGEEYSILL